jgi:hypothetical protein
MAGNTAKPQTKTQNIAAWFVAALIVLAALGAGVYLVLHIVHVIRATLAFLSGGIFALSIWLGWKKQFDKLSVKPWFDNKWTWLGTLGLSVVLFWWRGEAALFIAFTLLFLRLFASPTKAKQKKDVGLQHGNEQGKIPAEGEPH